MNLPAAQLQVAMGIPLHRIPDIRVLYGFDRYSDAFIDQDVAKPLPPRVHVIAARITAENTDRPVAALVPFLLPLVMLPRCCC